MVFISKSGALKLCKRPLGREGGSKGKESKTSWKDSCAQDGACEDRRKLMSFLIALTLIVFLQKPGPFIITVQHTPGPGIRGVWRRSVVGGAIGWPTTASPRRRPAGKWQCPSDVPAWSHSWPALTRSVQENEFGEQLFILAQMAQHRATAPCASTLPSTLHIA